MAIDLHVALKQTSLVEDIPWVTNAGTDPVQAFSLLAVEWRDLLTLHRHSVSEICDLGFQLGVLLFQRCSHLLLD